MNRLGTWLATHLPIVVAALVLTGAGAVVAATGDKTLPSGLQIDSNAQLISAPRISTIAFQTGDKFLPSGLLIDSNGQLVSTLRDSSGNALPPQGGACGVAAVAMGSVCTITGAPSNNCTPGALALRSDGTADTTLYVCTATNTWTVVALANPAFTTATVGTTFTGQNTNILAIGSSANAANAMEFRNTNSGSSASGVINLSDDGKLAILQFLMRSAANTSGIAGLAGNTTIFINSAGTGARDLAIGTNTASALYAYTNGTIRETITSAGAWSYAIAGITCSATNAYPCAFTWTCTMSSGNCTTTQAVPAGCRGVLTPTVSPNLSATNVVSTWVTLSGTTLTVHVSDLLGTSSAAFSGNGSCL